MILVHQENRLWSQCMNIIKNNMCFTKEKNFKEIKISRILSDSEIHLHSDVIGKTNRDIMTQLFRSFN